VQHHTETIALAQFGQVDIRVGTIISASEFPKARKPAYRLLIDFGPLGIRRSSAQITALYHPQELVGMQVLAVVNLPPRQVADFISEVLVLGVPSNHHDVALLAPERPMPNGSVIR
jgi:tRNA-binding protein